MFEIWEPAGQGRTLARPVGKRVRARELMGEGQITAWSEGGGEDRCSLDRQETDRKGMLQMDVALVLRDPGIDGTAGLPSVDLITLAGYAVHAWSRESQVVFHRPRKRQT
jgi:hypothetical protein